MDRIFRIETFIFFYSVLLMSCMIKNSQESTPDSDKLETSIQFLNKIENPTYDLMVKSFPDSVMNSKVAHIQKYEIRNEEWRLLSSSNKDLDQTSALLKSIFEIQDTIFEKLSDSIDDKSILNFSIKELPKLGKNYFILILGNPTMEWSNPFYVLQKEVNSWMALGPIDNFHRYGPVIGGYRNRSQDVIIYFSENFGSGSGIWQHNYFFYKLEEDQMKPVLNWAKDCNFQWPGSRVFSLSAEILSFSPLKVKTRYWNEIRPSSDIIKCSNKKLVFSDSLEIHFDWDENNEKYNGQGLNFKNVDLLAYDLNTYAELQFIKSNKSYFEDILNSDKPDSSQCIIASYICEVENSILRMR